MTQHNIINHIESFLGKFDDAWKINDSEDAISVVCFKNKPVKGMNTYSTLGLSHHSLSMPREREIRQEFVFIALNTIPSDDVASFLLSFSDFIITKHDALLRGEIAGPEEPIVSSSSMNAIYASMPVIFDDALATFRETSPSTVLVWLIPIYENEAEYVQKYGWEAFEDLLEKEDPDLWDLNRKSII